MPDKPENNGQKLPANSKFVRPVHGPQGGGPATKAELPGGARSLADGFRTVLGLSREVPDPVVFAEAQARLALAEGVVVDAMPLVKWQQADDAKKAAKVQAAAPKK